MILLKRLHAHRFKQLENVTLHFPERGSILIEGSNEAGKSSLFEAVYFALFGRTLLTDKGYRLDHLRQYNATEMVVELDFTIDGRSFSISRQLIGEKSRAKLQCPAAGGMAETITGLREIDRRIQAEIHLSPDGLLNTCFVEQKRLERLENLDAAKRSEAVNDLLNLGALTALAANFKVKSEDQVQIQMLRQRVDVAKLDDLLPAIERSVTEASLCLCFAQAEEAAGRLAQITEQLEAATSERGQICALLDEAQSRLQESIQLRSRITALDQIVGPAIDAWGTALRLRQDGGRRLQDLETLAADLPQREESLRGACELLTQLEDLENLKRDAVRINAALAALRQDTLNLDNRLDSLAGQIAAARDGEQAAAELVRQASIHQASVEWVEAADWLREDRRVETLALQLSTRYQEAQDRQNASDQALRRSVRQQKTGFALIAAAVILAAAGGATGYLAALGLVGVVLFVPAALLSFRGGSGAAIAREALAAAKTEAAQLEGESRATRARQDEAAAQRERWMEREVDCREIIRSIPGSDAQLDFEDARKTAAVRPAVLLPEARNHHAGAAASLLALTREQEVAAETRAKLNSGMDEQDAALTVNTAAQNRLAPVIRELQDLELPIETGPLRAELTVRQAALQRDRDSIVLTRDARAALKSLESDLQSKEAATRTRWREAVPNEVLPETAREGRDRLPALMLAAAAERDRLDESAILLEISDLEQGIASHSRQIHHLEQDSGRALAERDAFREEMRRRLQASPNGERDSLPAPELERLKAQVGASGPSEWRERLREREEVRRDNRITRAARAQQADIPSDPLSLPDEQEALAAAEQARQVKRRAGEIVEKTRESIVSRVMPLTIQNMRQLLPLLTEGRYQEAEWDESSNTISIYDNLARSYQSKRVFSGGARDQISLSLRLAFALATLPGERQCRPGFLFLDEPLSSFDRPRTQALVNLLTRGLLSEKFAQILLISHSESFDPEQFDYRLRMEGGRVVESTLGGRKTPEA